MRFPEKAVRLLADAVYPRRCAMCDEALYPAEKGICKDCAERTRFPEQEPVIHGKHAFDRVLALFSYRDIAPSIYRLKYMGRQEYASFYADAFVARYKSKLERFRFDALIPVPLSGKRYRKRGYNQAECLAKALSARIRVPVLSDLIVRKKDTLPQKCLDYYERRNNLKNAFIMKKNDVSLKSVALVDDIYTTGATADRVASLLKKSGVSFVCVLVPAIGELQYEGMKRR